MQTADAFNLLRELNAPPRLLRHAELVAEVAGLLSDKLRLLGVPHDRELVLVAAILHDAGKLVHPEELTGGNQHEDAGERFLLEHGISPAIARCCRSHGQWSSMNCTLEEHLVALADTLWKGVRNDRLELLVIDEAAKRLGKTRWDVFMSLDSYFETIAADATKRLGRASR